MLLSSVLKALVRRPRRPDALLPAAHSDRIQEAVTARESGDVNRALDILRGILSQHPDEPYAHYFAGVWHAQDGHLEQALRHLERAARSMPDEPDVQLALGNVYRATGDRQHAETAYRAAIDLAPNTAAGYYNLALLLKAIGNHGEALLYLERACDLPPYIEDAWRERITALVALGRYADAIAAGRVAVARDSHHGAFWSCLGYAHQKAHEPRAALECYERAKALGVRDHDVSSNVAIVYQDLGRMGEAVRAYEEAIAAKPDHVLAKFHLALARLSLRQYEQGWDDYELRLLSEESVIRIDPQREWHGQPLAGRSIVVIGEQGLGDEIMFASCFDEVIAAASRCVVTCSPRLERLFQRSFPAAEVLAVGPESTVAVRDVDYQVAAGSLPKYLRRSVAAFPRHSGYLKADPARVERWRNRLAALGPGLKVGISWRGGTHKTRAPLRTLPLAEWRPIFDVPDIHFVSLQYGSVQEDLQSASNRIVHWQEAIDDYDETAALVCALDLVVSVCTAVIHLAGALGQQVWIMAPLSPEWRYAAAGDRMDWYPSSRMFRQNEFGNWLPVVETVVRELAAAAASVQR
ncbi:MAG: tetratricopeptide repeat protein [Rhodospirillaceae bacterium]